MLAYFCSKGQIERVSRGIYKIKDLDFDRDFEWEDLVLTALSIPNGVICLISALCYYGLTDEIMREFWIAVPHSTTSPARENAHIVRMRNISFGQTTIKIGSQKAQNFRPGTDSRGLFPLSGQGNCFKGVASLFKDKQRQKTRHRQASKVCEEA